MVEIANCTKSALDQKFLHRVATQLLRKEKRGNADLSVVIVDAKRMKEMSRAYKGKQEPANVLSFPIRELGLGEVVLCKSVIAKDAKKYGITEKRAIAFMMVHGILHLLGYSHKTMEKKESYYR